MWYFGCMSYICFSGLLNGEYISIFLSLSCSLTVTGVCVCVLTFVPSPPPSYPC